MSELTLTLAPFAFVLGIGIAGAQERLRQRRILQAQRSEGESLNAATYNTSPRGNQE